MARIGSLIELPSLYPHHTGRENLEVTRRQLGVPRASIDRVLRIVGLVADADRLARARIAASPLAAHVQWVEHDI